MTTRKRRLQVFLGSLGCVSLALVLVAEAAAAPASAQSGRKRRAGLTVSDEEFGIRPAAWLTLRPVWLPPGTDQKPPAAPLVAETLAIETRAVTATPRRGGHGSTGIPKVVPPFPGPPPASPIR